MIPGFEENRPSRLPHVRGGLAGPRLPRGLAPLLLVLAVFPVGGHAQPAAEVGTAAATGEAIAVQVQAYEVVGNTLLPQAVIDDRLATFLGAQTLARLKDAAAAVQELYRRAGYGGVVAFLPEQTAGGGVVRIRVVEGRLKRITVSGQQHYTEANIRGSLPALQLGRTPEVRRIDAQIQMANENPAKTVQVLLQPGDDPGSIAAQVTVAEQPVQRFTLRTDNTGSDRTGRWRAALGWQHADAWGLDHVVSAELQTAPQKPSTVAVFSGAYRAPLYERALALDAYGAWSDVDGGKTNVAAGDLQFNGRGFVLGGRVSAYLPRLGNIDQRASVGLELRDYRNSCTIDGLPQDACGSAGASVSLHPLSVGYTAQASGELAWGVSLNLTTNLALGGNSSSVAAFEAARAGSSPRYLVMRASGNLSTALAGIASLQMRASGQYSGKPLVPGELFGIGGAQTVRGYEERELSGDWGAQATLEVGSTNVAEAWFKWSQADLRAIAFVDAGWAGNRHGDPCQTGRSSCRIGAVGLGARVNWRDVQLRMDLGHALAEGTRTHRGDNRLHAALNFSF